MSAVRVIYTPGGRRFAYVGDYTLRDGDGGGWTVSRDIDGDEVRVATGLTLDEAVQLAEAKA